MTLDVIGHAILSEVDGTLSFVDIADQLEKTFGAPLDQVTEDSAGFLGALRDRRFLDVVA